MRNPPRAGASGKVGHDITLTAKNQTQPIHSASERHPFPGAVATRVPPSEEPIGAGPLVTKVGSGKHLSLTWRNRIADISSLHRTRDGGSAASNHGALRRKTLVKRGNPYRNGAATV